MKNVFVKIGVLFLLFLAVETANCQNTVAVNASAVSGLSMESALQQSPLQFITLNISKTSENKSILANPNVVYLLLLLGMMAVLFEFFNPGGMISLIIGVICLLFAFYGMTMIPIDYFGLTLIIMAVVLFVLELKFPSHAILSIIGVACLFFGSMYLIKTSPASDVRQISWYVLIPSVIVVSAFFIFLIGIGLKAQRNAPVVGGSNLVGLKGKAVETIATKGRVKVNGEFWDAVSENEEIQKGAEIEVVAVNNFKLTVKLLSLQSK